MIPTRNNSQDFPEISPEIFPEIFPPEYFPRGTIPDNSSPRFPQGVSPKIPPPVPSKTPLINQPLDLSNHFHCSHRPVWPYNAEVSLGEGTPRKRPNLTLAHRRAWLKTRDLRLPPQGLLEPQPPLRPGPLTAMYMLGPLTTLLFAGLSIGEVIPLGLRQPVSYPYQEVLTLRPLPANNVLASFSFSLSSQALVGETDLSAYDVFPRALGPVIQATNTKELHLRFAQGWWDAELWGKLPFNGTRSGGTGVELWAVIEAESLAAAFTQWVELANGLSGLFCASLNHITPAVTAHPLNSFQSEQPTYIQTGKNYYLLRAALPSEPVCTENLTPFLKLVPTRGKQGIALLLDGHRLFDTQWQSMAIDITTVCNEHCVLQMEETISSVIDVPRSLRTNLNRIPHAEKTENLRCDPTKHHSEWQCFPVGAARNVLFDTLDLFGKAIKGSSALGAPSQVCVEAPESWVVSSTHHKEVKGCVEIPQADFNLQFQTSDSTSVSHHELPPVMVSRSLTGTGQDNGGIRVVLTNPSTQDIALTYFETLPWFVRVYLHSLKTLVGGSPGPVLKDIYYKPAVDRTRPTQLELSLVVPAGSTLTMTYEFDKSLLLYAEYPPDPAHGFGIEPAVLITSEGYELRTTSLLLTLPLPDFSMPYNVIIMTCTVLALTYGTVFNLLVKRTVLESEAKALPQTGIVAIVKAQISTLTRKMKPE